VEIVRLNWVDTPEIRKDNQPLRNIFDERQWYWGQRAITEVQNFVDSAARPGYIWVREYERDKYGRVLADIFSDYRYLIKDNLQYHLLRLGLATDFFPRMEKIVSESEYQRISLFTAFLRAEYWSKYHKQGIWGDPNFICPFEYRQTWE